MGRNSIPIKLFPGRVRLCDAALVLLTPAACVVLLEGFTRGGLAACLDWITSRPLMFLANCAPFLGAALCLSFIAGYRARVISSLALALVSALYGIANRYKLVYRAEPILFTDVTQLGDAAAVVTGLNFEIDYAQLAWVGLAFAALIALCAVFVKGRREARPVLLPVIGLALMLLPCLYTFELAGGSRIDITDHANAEGSLYAASALENNRRALMRSDYSEDEITESARELQARALEAQTGDAKPNIILVLAESFTDEQFLGKYLHLTDALMPYYNGLMDESAHGHIYVPKIGGGTSETEFEVLTGLRSRYSINPYSMGLPPISSLASILRARGYESTAIHWYAGVYYNRYHNLKMEGFNAFYTTDTTDRDFEKVGMFVSDAEHFRSIVKQMEETEKRDFIFCLTMQNHGGYGYDDFRESLGADTPFTNELSDESTMLAANYCCLLRRSDEALRELVETLRGLDEPTMLVYFGDHLPPLGAKVYEELGMPSSGDAGHMTPYFIWSNYKTLAGEADMRAFELGAYALELAGMGDDYYMREVERLRRAGVTEDATLDMLGYDALFGGQHAYRELGVSPECDTFEIGGKMELAGFRAARIGDAVYLRPKLAISDQMYTLYVNGKPCGTRFIRADERGALRLKCVMRNSNGRVFNESGTLEYTGVDELMKRSDELAYTAYALHESEYAREGGSGNTGVFVSERRFDAGQLSAATLGGESLEWQPVHGVKKAGQFGVDADGRVHIAVDMRQIAGDDTGDDEAACEALKRYLEVNDATLYAFEGR